MNYLLELLRIAAADTCASRALHQAGHHAQAYFLFQQAAEKANKAFGLYNQEVTVDELQQKIVHKSLKVYHRMLHT